MESGKETNRNTKITKSYYFRKEYLGRGFATGCGIFIIVLTFAIGIFLLVRGTGTFTKFHHSIAEFLFSADWSPVDTAQGSGGGVGAAIFIVGSLLTCGLALAMITPFALGAAVFMTEIAPKAGEKIFRPAVEIFVGIPSVVYGWIGLTVLVPFIRDVFHAKMGGYSVLAASIVLAVMIFPTITTFGEALAVAMVIGKTKSFPKNLLSPTSNLTAEIAADMGNTASGGEANMALWSMALLLFLISMLFIFLIHLISGSGKKKEKD